MTAEVADEAAGLSDRLHPILVRDIKQATRSRVYSVAMIVACISVVAIGLLAVDRDRDAIDLSRWILVTSLQCLAPLLLFAIPLMAFLSLREEVSEHTADQLILTGMRPLSVIVGMLLAALVQSVLFVSMFAPLLGFSFLLLNVDVLTLVQALWLLLLGSTLATSVAFALIRIRLIPQLREYVALIAILVLAAATIEAMTRADELVTWMEANARASDFWLLALQQTTVLGLATVFFGLIGAGSLTHIKENRATSFRVLGLVAAPTFTLYFGAGMHGAAAACLALFPFWFTAVTDPLALSPRHKPLVPKSRSLALRMMPLLPGSGRGLIYAMVLAVITFVSGVATHFTFFGRLPTDAELLYGLLGCEYLLTYAAVFCYLRNHYFEQNRMTTPIARVRLPGLTIMVWFGLLIVDLVFAFLTSQTMFLLSMVNPFWTLLGPSTMPHAVTAIVLAGVLAVYARLNMGDVRASVREVLYGESPPRPVTKQFRRSARRKASRGIADGPKQ